MREFIRSHSRALATFSRGKGHTQISVESFFFVCFQSDNLTSIFFVPPPFLFPFSWKLLKYHFVTLTLYLKKKKKTLSSLFHFFSPCDICLGFYLGNFFFKRKKSQIHWRFGWHLKFWLYLLLSFLSFKMYFFRPIASFLSPYLSLFLLLF